ncbi:unnamed protein product [Mytilus edulis]|uniref:Fucolectin tachylectin-4 pentraxin-1 domain-containing protein n=1 Tax=Mytilus edulis TaxID=6550 RepID=A0A8S3VQ30_MYTED|nr:unnamed protein product [Mytilus edulis]
MGETRIYVIHLHNDRRNPYHLENVALGKESRQSSIRWNSSLNGPLQANDGSRNSISVGGGCSHTEFDTHNFWWAVDLEVEFIIEIVTIYGRTDCCTERLRDFDILLYNPSDASWDGYDQGTQNCVIIKLEKLQEPDCPCSCKNHHNEQPKTSQDIQKHTKEELRQILQPQITELQNEMKLDKKNISRWKRNYISVADKRESARYMGIVGVVVLGAIVGTVVLLDLLSLQKHIRQIRRIRGQ